METEEKKHVREMTKNTEKGAWQRGRQSCERQGKRDGVWGALNVEHPWEGKLGFWGLIFCHWLLPCAPHKVCLFMLNKPLSIRWLRLGWYRGGMYETEVEFWFCGSTALQSEESFLVLRKMIFKLKSWYENDHLLWQITVLKYDRFYFNAKFRKVDI